MIFAPEILFQLNVFCFLGESKNLETPIYIKIFLIHHVSKTLLNPQLRRLKCQIINQCVEIASWKASTRNCFCLCSNNSHCGAWLTLFQSLPNTSNHLQALRESIWDFIPDKLQKESMAGYKDDYQYNRHGHKALTEQIVEEELYTISTKRFLLEWNMVYLVGFF